MNDPLTALVRFRIFTDSRQWVRFRTFQTVSAVNVFESFKPLKPDGIFATDLTVRVPLSPAALLVHVVGSSSSCAGAGTYQSAFPPAYQSTGTRTYRSTDPNSLSCFSLPCFRIMSVPLVGIRRRRKSSNQHKPG